MRTIIKLIFISSIIFCFLSCDKKNDNDLVYEIPNFTSTKTEFADNELLNATYTDYKFPSNFYHENLGDTKELIDYLWFVKNYNNGSKKILSSFTVDNQQIFEVHHYELFIVYGDFNLYDGITLIKKVYEVERNTGVITVTEAVIRKINGEYN